MAWRLPDARGFGIEAQDVSNASIGRWLWQLFGAAALSRSKYLMRYMDRGVTLVR
jgi:hypothetical protein